MKVYEPLCNQTGFQRKRKIFTALYYVADHLPKYIEEGHEFKPEMKQEYEIERKQRKKIEKENEYFKSLSIANFLFIIMTHKPGGSAR
jgi:hypothetical protein